MFPPHITPAVVRLHQFVMAMMPRRWSSVRLDGERDASGRFVQLVNFDVEIKPGLDIRGAMPPALGWGQFEIVTEINAALRDFAAGVGEAWRGSSIRIDRAEDGSASVVPLAPGGTDQGRIRLPSDTVDCLKLSDELFDALDATRATALAKQGPFEDKIRACETWNVVQETNELSFELPRGGQLSFRGQALGSWSHVDDTWLWAWRHPSLVPSFAAASVRVREEGARRRRLAALTSECFEAREPFARELALLASVVVGAQGVFAAPTGKGLLFIAAMP